MKKRVSLKGLVLSRRAAFTVDSKNLTVTASAPVGHLTWVLLTEINTYQANAYPLQTEKKKKKKEAYKDIEPDNSNKSRFLTGKKEKRMKKDISLFICFFLSFRYEFCEF